MADRVLIIGASARAAAASARRAGLEPFAVDLFADADTQLLCECVKCPPDEYPEGLFRRAKQMPPMPWMYTGGLENYPALVGDLAAERELWGNGPDVLRRVRDPFAVAALLSEKKLAHAPPFAAPSPFSLGRRWLRKPIVGSAGRGIRFATSRDTRRPSPGSYFQEYIPGQPMSAVFVGTRAGHSPFGITTQLIGTPWLHAGGFRYAGNVASVGFGPELRDVLLAGLHLATWGRIAGFFGVDFVLHRGVSTTIELNPRYPASAEVLEYVDRWEAVGRHQRACTVGRRTVQPTRPSNRVVGKGIYHAPYRLTFPPTGPWEDSLTLVCEDVWRRPDFADIPHPGDVIEAGQPVLTVLTGAETEVACLEQLQSRAAELDRLFGFTPPREESSCPR